MNENEHPEESIPPVIRSTNYHTIKAIEEIAMELALLSKIAIAANRLETFLAKNMASEPERKDEWNGIITCHDKKTADDLGQRLTDLVMALKPYRESLPDLCPKCCKATIDEKCANPGKLCQSCDSQLP